MRSTSKGTKKYEKNKKKAAEKELTEKWGE